MHEILIRLFQIKKVQPDQAEIIYNSETGWTVNVLMNSDLQNSINQLITKHYEKRNRI